MLSSPIQKQYRVLAPVLSVLIEPACQRSEEQFNDVSVVGHLKECKVEIALGVNRTDHVNSRIHLMAGDRIGPTVDLSFLQLELRLVQPRFIDVKNPLILA